MSEDLVARIEDLERRVAALEHPSQEQKAVPIESKPISLREFVISKSPKTSIDTSLVIVYYLEKYSKIVPFNVDDLSKGFNQAKEKPPLNLSDMIAKNARRGFLMESNEKKGTTKGWTLTNSGERFVENDLQEQPAK